MPIIDGSDFRPPKRYRKGHYSTFVPYLLGSKPSLDYQRERIDTPDNDFLDLDYLVNGQPRLAVLCHGLEGDSRSGYVLLFADYLSSQGWDVLALNYRGCSGEMNHRLQMYNSGTTEDLHIAIHHRLDQYEELALIGYSLGGNLVLKYLGEDKFDLTPKIRSALAISTPLHLDDASRQLLQWDNILYQWRFLLSLSKKIIKKKHQYPEVIKRRKLLRCTNLYKFDDLFTAPLFGYKDAADYYASNQSLQWLDNIKIPSLIINAVDDPFLGPKSYPAKLVSDLVNVGLCMPDYGGHVGFASSKNDRSWILGKTNTFLNGPLQFLQQNSHFSNLDM